MLLVQQNIAAQKIIEPEIVFIKGGTYSRFSNMVTLDDFWMGKTEITVAEFENFVNDSHYVTNCEMLCTPCIADTSQPIPYGVCYFGETNMISCNCSRKGVDWRYDAVGNARPRQEYNHPVSLIDWVDATAYCQWLRKKTGKKYRLPTEAEWEYAAGDGNGFYNYNDSCQYVGKKGKGNVNDSASHDFFKSWVELKNMVLGDDGYRLTAPVASYEPNEKGLYDMCGNLWEMCDVVDFRCENQHLYNPEGIHSDSNTAKPCISLKGGSFCSELEEITYKRVGDESFSIFYLGFRVVCEKP